MNIYKDYYIDHRDEIIKYFREMVEKGQLPENDEDLENWYIKNLLEIAEEWYDEEALEKVISNENEKDIEIIIKQKNYAQNLLKQKSDMIKQEDESEKNEK